EALALQCAGLQVKGDKAAVNSDKGVMLRWMFDWPGGGARPGDEQTYPPAVMLQTVHDTLRGQIDKGEGPFAQLTPAQRAKAIANLDANFNWRLLTGGFARSDHRKVTV